VRKGPEESGPGERWASRKLMKRDTGRKLERAWMRVVRGEKEKERPRLGNRERLMQAERASQGRTQKKKSVEAISALERRRRRGCKPRGGGLPFWPGNRLEGY